MSESQQTVFVVDDDEAVRRALTRSLGLRGYNVTTFDSAESFLQSNQYRQPGCLILDLSMPGMSGLELQQELIHRNATLPIVFVSGHGESPTSFRATDSGAIDFLEKPYPVEQLLERIEQAFTAD